ncbi:helix-hairpin-helix domain-containing protein [Paenibacillus cremeus]|uniref:AAA family ATPase n=1 Tax=Paenibacillus cremeus TaxID=2163881 RepID=A0A559KCT4_9BACL|nr:helix-hairpin-helix domain-containing protein [Paenibacillus cremeus]TVY09937.1 AAA family ATPase [Paenibacillus cremeus]
MSKNIIEVEIVPTKKLFYNNSFGIYSAIPQNPNDEHLFQLNSYGNFCIKGKMQELILDIVYKAKLEGVEDKKYGFGYNVHTIYRDVPKTNQEKRDFLSTMMTELQLSAFYNAYPNQDILEMFIHNTFELFKIKGIGSKTYNKIRKKLLENVEQQSLFAELGKYGVKYEHFSKLIDVFGTADNAIEKVKKNPYCLAEHLHGIGFKKADIIAKNMGIPDNSKFRIQAGIKHIISEEEQSGHTYLEYDDLLEKAAECLVLDRGLIEPEIDKTEGLYIEDDKIALRKTYDAESDVAKLLLNRLNKSTTLNIDIGEFLITQEREMGMTLTDKQKEFFHNFAKYNVNFLIGSAGMGKSALQKILINLAKKMNAETNVLDTIEVKYDEYSDETDVEDGGSSAIKYRLLAPTGRAAKVLSTYVGDTEASTIHRAIGYGRQEKNKEDKANYELREDIIIIDEVSMMDVRLACVLLKKIVNPFARVVFIGDDAQIASVGCGNFLRNCLDSGVLPVTKLDKVFRQAEGGGLSIATDVRQGHKFIESNFVGEKKFGSDALLRSVSQEHMEDGYKYYYKLLLQYYKPEDIMVLTPTKKGNLGTVMINKHIQSIVNPPDEMKKELKYHDDCTFRIGDYVMNTKNTYEIRDLNGSWVDIVNGDTGVIVDIVKESDLEATATNETDDNVDDNVDDEEDLSHKIGIYVQFDVGIVSIPFEKMEQLMHGWALTMHKSQGGSGQGVLCILDKSHKFQLNANLIYTAITRFKQRVIILCQAETLNFACKKFENMRRRTFLENLLRTTKERLNEVIA